MSEQQRSEEQRVGVGATAGLAALAIAGRFEDIPIEGVDSPEVEPDLTRLMSLLFAASAPLGRDVATG